MSYNYTLDKLQTHPYLGTWTADTHMCKSKPYTMKSVETQKKEKKCNKSNDHQKTHKQMMKQAVIQTVDKINKENTRKLKLQQMGAQNQVPLVDIRKRSTSTQSSRNQTTDTTDKIVKLKNDMKEKLGKLKIATEEEINTDRLKEKHREKVRTLNKKLKTLQEVKQFATNDLPNSYNYKKIAKQIAELNKTKAELTKQMEIQKKQGQISTAELTQTKINSIMMKINLLNKPYIEYQKKVVAEKKKNIEKQKKLQKALKKKLELESLKLKKKQKEELQKKIREAKLKAEKEKKAIALRVQKVEKMKKFQKQVKKDIEQEKKNIKQKLRNTKRKYSKKPVKKIVTFNMDFKKVVGNKKNQFLKECSEKMKPLKCTDVKKGSIVVILSGTRQQIKKKANTVLKKVVKEGIKLPSFGDLGKAKPVKLFDCACYLGKNKDLQNKLQDNCKKARKHWRKTGRKQKRDAWCSPVEKKKMVVELKQRKLDRAEKVKAEKKAIQ